MGQQHPDIECRVCASKHVSEVVQSQGVFRCQTCSSLSRIPFNIGPAFYSDTNYWWLEDEWLRLYQKSFFVWFEEDIPTDRASLEIGAANGDFLRLVQKTTKGPVVYNDLFYLARPEYDFPERMIGIAERCDLWFKLQKHPVNVFMIDVIEHLERPFGVFTHLPEGSRVFCVTADGDALHADDEMFLHLEHSCIMTQQGIQLATRKYGFTIFKYYRHPQGLSIFILEKI
jgi:hypothetical protein